MAVGLGEESDGHEPRAVLVIEFPSGMDEFAHLNWPTLIV
jgi:hypothetical protein